MQQQQQQSGPQYGSQSPTDLTPFPSRPQFSTIHPDAPSPISSRPPPVHNFGELATTAAGAFHEDDVLAAGEEAERGGTPGNRWPREETLALLKIRSEMDAAFKDASLKGPLWENVSRKLGELGYIRSAKKCKEKFENVHKYYKRTKEGRAGRQDGKSYRFFTQLEALHTPSGGIAITGSGSGSSTPTTAMPNPIPALPAATVVPTWASIQPSPPPSITAPLPPPPAHAPTPAPSTVPQPHAPAVTAGISFSSDTFSSSSYESDDEDTEEGEGRKRKRGSGGPGGSRKMMAFFEGLMMQVMQKQEAMQQRFLETIEKREQDRTAREEAWKRQELARLNREHEMLAQERAVAASRDAALISFLQKIGGGQAVPVAPPPAPSPRPAPVQPTPPPSRPAVLHIAPPPPPPPAPAPVPAPAPALAPAPAPTQPPEQMVQKETQQPIQHQHIAPTPPPVPVQQQQAPPRQIDEIVIAQNQPSSSCTELVPVPEQHETVATPRGALELGVSPSRWPKSEVHALIKLRSGLEGRYQEAGPKGPLWEEISAGMQRLGYNRSSKRCKEKWENINKYFKKVKESNKKRPEDAKTCPYFHQLDALYRKKNLGSTSNPGYSIENNPQTPTPPSQPLQPQPLQAPQPIQTQQIQPETERKSETEKNAGNPGGGIQIQTSNGGLPSSFFEGGAAAMNKPEDIMKELMEQQHRRQAAMNNYNKMEQPHTDHNMYQDDEDDDDEDDEDDEDANMVYKMQFERQNVGNGGGGGGNASAKPAATTTAGSFLGMVQ